MVHVFLIIFITYVLDEEEADGGICHSQWLWRTVLACISEDSIQITHQESGTVKSIYGVAMRWEICAIIMQDYNT